MAIFKCKMCGGDLDVQAGVSVVECDYCGTKQTVPAADDEKKLTLFNRANRLRLNNEFDKASGVYEAIVADFPEEAEAYWGLLLCNYGVEYVDDPATGKKVPTCHRSSFDSISDDQNLEMACEYADAYARRQYRDEAKQLEEIRKGIIEVSSKEEPYDIFICYKETDENGDRTLDSVLAQDVYDALTDKGYRVFFSRITLEDKLGTEYEPYIFAALNSAKVMLAFGTDYEYYNAVWVKNEWSRFLRLMAAGQKKMLIPCYKGIDAYDMPKEFAKLQAQDMGKVGAMQDLIRGIDKIFDRDKKPAAAPVAAAVASGAPTVAPLLERAFMFLEDGEWKKADDLLEQVLNQDPKNAQAYLGKLLAEAKACKLDDLKNCDQPFDHSDNYQKALRFGDEKLEAEMRGYIAHINERNENAEREYKEKIKNIAKAVISHEDSASFEKRKEQLQSEIVLLERKIIEFPSNPERASVVKETINTLSSQKASLNLKKSNLGFFKIKEKQEIDESISEIDKKINIFQGELQILESEIDEYKSVAAIEVLTAEKQKKLDELISDSTLCSDLSISYEDAIKELSGNDSLRSDVFAAYPKLRWVMAKVRDCVAFGKYHQTALGVNSTPIQWRVLAKENNRVLIISEKALDRQRYNTSNTNVTWETCSLRKWMNGTFLNNAFSAEEQAQIQNTNVSADENPQYSTNPGNATTDKVFLLSITEAEKYLTTDESRKCVPTAFTKEQGAYVDKQFTTASGEATCWWWLRSPGRIQNYDAFVYNDGSVRCRGLDVCNNFGCVRPAMWIDLSKL